jgi:hypothetical protein
MPNPEHSLQSWPWRWAIQATDPRLPDDWFTIGAYLTRWGANRQAKHLNTLAGIQGCKHRWKVVPRVR